MKKQLAILLKRAAEKSANATRKAPRSAVSNQPSGLLLSPRFPTYRNVYREDCC